MLFENDHRSSYSSKRYGDRLIYIQFVLGLPMFVIVLFIPSFDTLCVLFVYLSFVLHIDNFRIGFWSC